MFGKPRPRVWNKRKAGVPADAVYVGRPSVWGNPWQVGVDGTRDQVIEKFRTHTLPNLDVRPLRGKHLVCWRAPRRCHADLLLKKANA